MKRNKSIPIILITVCIIIIFAACGKNPVASSSMVSQKPARSTTLSEYLQDIKRQSGISQVQTVLKALDSGADGLNADGNNTYYNYFIKLLGDYLQTEASAKYTSSDLSRLSPNLRLFKTANKRIIAYEPSPSVYGECNAGNFAFIQQVENGKITIMPLYTCVTKHIGYVYEQAENFIIIAGEDKYANPYFAYIDGFTLSDKKAERSPVLCEHTDKVWRITSADGWIRRNANGNIGTSIVSAADSMIQIQSTDQRKINFIYNKQERKYSIHEAL